MRLTLTVLRCPPAVAPETRTLTGGEFTVGRGPGVDWVLTDVNQMVSRRHCTLAFRGGIWQVIDDSANGTFPNHDEEPIGRGNKRTLADHDRLRIGPYEIEVHLAQDDMFRPGRPGAYGDPTDVDPGYVDPGRPESFADDPFSDPLWAANTTPPAYDSSFAGRTQDDHSSILNDAMRPPNPVGMMPVAQGGLGGGTIPADDLLPEGWENDLLAELPDTAPVVAKLAPRLEASRPPPAPPTAPIRSAPITPAPAMAQPPRDGEAPQGDNALLAAFLAGAGLPDAALSDPVATMQRLGETYRALVAGLRAVLIARASIKSEFRIEQTMIQARGNNPLKFSANDDDAVSALLGVGRRTDMGPAKAVTEALRDIRLHELASMAAMQSAVRALLQGLGPEKVRASVEQGGRSVLPGQKKARAWDAYEALHARIAQALSDDFDSVFGKAFARAYEEAFDDLAARDRR